MIRKVAAVIGLLAITRMGVSDAYDAETHALIAFYGYKNSSLAQTGSGSVLNRLGLDRLDKPTPFNIYWQASGSTPGPLFYYDNTPPTFNPNTYQRLPTEYERCQFNNLTNVPNPASPNSYINWLQGDPMLGADGVTVTYFSVANWLMRGDLREDDIGDLGYFFAPEKCGKPDPDLYGGIVRVTNHFYDPINDIPLNNGCTFGYNHVCAKSVDWALGYVDSFATPTVVDTSRRNHFTYVDARENMWRALIGQHGRPSGVVNNENNSTRAADSVERLYRWSTTFRSLGDVIHLLQDGAQPQHVRNDPHSPFTSGERQAYEGYTNARVVGPGIAKVNAYVTEFFTQPGSLHLPIAVTGSYPAVTFATPVRFFTTRLKSDGSNVLPDNRYGLMDYTNRSFFTGGTLPGSPADAFLEPSNTIDSSYTAVLQPCVAAANIAATITNLKCKHLMHAVPDSVNPSYADSLPSGFTSPPLLLQSMFSAVVPGSPIARPHSGYSMGLEEFQAQGNLTIPRAIGYSAGMLNYFFRGTIDVETSSAGVLSVVNQGVAHSMNQYGYPCVGGAPADGCAIFGFTTLRIKLRNTTATMTESGTAASIPQTMATTAAGDPTSSSFTGPYLVAVARYHRNQCYTPQLGGLPVKIYSGTITNPSPTCANGLTRSDYQEISVSQSISVPAATLNGAALTEQLFDFSKDPIPVNATDLFLQIVYRGPLGQEQDGIAIGTLDVPEPTFVAFWNNTDYFLNPSGAWTADTSAPNIRQTVTRFDFCDSPSEIYQFISSGAGDVIGFPGTSPDDNPGSVRLGLLLNAQPSNPNGTVGMRAKATFFGTTANPLQISIGFKPEVTQANVENLPASALAAPSSTCATTNPSATACWRFDAVLQRRGLIWGLDWHPMYVDQSAGAFPPDVDSPSPSPLPLPAFTTTTLRSDGVVLFNNSSLSNCSF
jgi:hypothetical protein